MKQSSKKHPQTAPVQKETEKLEQNQILPRFPVRKSELDRFKFGKKAYFTLVKAEQKTPLSLDVACGAKPFPNADVLCDLHIHKVPDRNMKPIRTEGKPFVLCDCHYLPFKDKAFDFVTSYYLIEHIDNPESLIKELKRVSKHGYIQCPSWLNELLYGEKVHKWIITKQKNTLYVHPFDGEKHFRLGFLFHKLYRLTVWQILHAIADETLNLFSVRYEF